MKTKEALTIISLSFLFGSMLSACNRMNWTDGAPEYHPITRAVILEDKEGDK